MAALFNIWNGYAELRKKKIIRIFSVVLLVLTGCIDSYTPPSTIKNYGYLVVDGILNTTDTVQFKLSRTQTVSSSDSNTPETNATVTIEELNGNSHTMVSDNNGNYILNPGLVDATKDLRMHIITNDGKEYASPYVAATVTPPIDSVSWKLLTVNGDPGVEVYVNSHDATSAAKYFLWRYEETWEYTSKYASDLIREGDSIRDRTAAELLSHCYSSSPSTTVLINSTTNLSQDIVSEFPLAHITLSSPKLSLRYSTLVKQYALTKDAYEYWIAIQKNTENLGSIFGSLPVQVTGNFTCISDPTIPVLGYFSVTNEQSKRIFITNLQIPAVQSIDPFYTDCPSIYLTVDMALEPTTELYLYPIYLRLVLIGYQLAPAECADCRYHGGSLKPPPFW